MDTPPKPERSLRARIFISPDEPRLRAGWRVAGQLAMLVCLLILFSCPFIIYLSQNPSGDILFMVAVGKGAGQVQPLTPGQIL